MSEDGKYATMVALRAMLWERATALVTHDAPSPYLFTEARDLAIVIDVLMREFTHD